MKSANLGVDPGNWRDDAAPLTTTIPLKLMRMALLMDNGLIRLV